MPDAAQPVIEDTKGDRCPRCLQTVPRKASRCPGCGQPIHSTRPLILTIGIAGVLVLLFAMLVMYKVMANEEAANSAVPVDENADQQHELFPDPPQASSGAEPAKPDPPTKPDKKPPLDEK
jgi:hypothetical protein